MKGMTYDSLIVCLLLVISCFSVALVLGRHDFPAPGPVRAASCSEGGLCSAAELAAMTPAQLSSLILRLQGATTSQEPSSSEENKQQQQRAVAADQPHLWPLPAAFAAGSAAVQLIPASFTLSGPTSDLPDLALAFARAKPLFFPHASSATSPNATPVLPGLIVEIADEKAELDLGVDESYHLSIPADGATPAKLSAQTIFGVYHGLQTLSQLIEFDFDSASYSIQNAPWSIDDKPRFPHRELLLDSSRHFLPLTTLKHVIDALTYIKINTIHWHIVDSQSFPFGSVSLPQLAAAGAWSATERYTVADLQEVVEYARQRGIRVMPELDVPGHAASWCKGDMSICPSPSCLEPLDPSSQHTFDVVATLQSDLAEIFPDHLMHLGGDEVNTACWTSTPRIANWMKQQGFTAEQAYLYFVNKGQQSARALGKWVVGWQEIWDYFGTSLDKNTIIHVWKGSSTVGINASLAGYRVLWNPEAWWYLDHLAVTSQTMYVQEPCSGVPDEVCEKLWIGGGGEQWGETADTSDLEATVFPRLAAIAERLWSPKNVNNWQAAVPRFQFIRCLLNARGIAAAPINNAQARTAPKEPGSCSQM